jgi:putative tryptophan/tyrosine transport system substrate-binding protein
MQFDRLKRREFIIRVGGAMVVWPIFAQAQETALKRWRIGSLFPAHPGTINPLPAVLEQSLADLGYQNGQNIGIITSNVPPQSEIVEGAIRALAPNIDILVVGSTIAGIAAKKVAPQLPTVFCAVGAPVDIGLVQSLAHPGGNMTGVAFEAAIEAYGRRLQILKEIVPRLARVGVLRAPGDANVKIAITSLERSAAQLGLTLSVFDVRSADDLESAFVDMQRSGMEAVIVVAGALTYANVRRISELALQGHLPSCHAFREAVIAGGLVSFGPDLAEIVRQGGSLSRQDHARSKTGRPSGPGADSFRPLRQSKNGGGARTNDPAGAARHRGRGDRIEMLFAAVHESGCGPQRRLVRCSDMSAIG